MFDITKSDPFKLQERVMGFNTVDCEIDHEKFIHMVHIPHYIQPWKPPPLSFRSTYIVTNDIMVRQTRYKETNTSQSHVHIQSSKVSLLGTESGMLVPGGWGRDSWGKEDGDSKGDVSVRQKEFY